MTKKKMILPMNRRKEIYGPTKDNAFCLSIMYSITIYIIFIYALIITPPLFGAQEEGLHYDYSDRLFQWNPEKSEVASNEANNSGRVKGSAEWYEKYLSVYCEEPVELKHVLAGVNLSDGYPYIVFGYRFASEQEENV